MHCHNNALHINSLWSSDIIWILINIGSGNGLLPDSTKPLPEPILSRLLFHSPESNSTGNTAVSNITAIHLEIAHFKSKPGLDMTLLIWAPYYHYCGLNSLGPHVACSTKAAFASLWPGLVLSKVMQCSFPQWCWLQMALSRTYIVTKTGYFFPNIYDIWVFFVKSMNVNGIR